MASNAATTLRAVKQAIREPYAWPGGYPVYIIMADGGPLSVKAAREHWRSIAHSTINGYGDGWAAYAAEINWESELFCAHSGERIESAYGEE
jgi:hypothetical protein